MQEKRGAAGKSARLPRQKTKPRARRRRQPIEATREKLLRATMAYARKHGLGQATLRQIAAALGTSHRMLGYCFGSKEGLLAAVVDSVEEEQRNALRELSQSTDIAPMEQLRRMWTRWVHPDMAAQERLFFEVYVQGLHEQAHAAPMMDGFVERWLDTLEELCRRAGVPAHDARIDARLIVAVARGLAMDMLATGDRKGVTAAFDRFLSRYEKS